MIVGFCDETEEDFLQTLDAVRYARFDMIYMGIYSPRPGTYAAKKYEDNVPRAVKKERRQRLNAVLTEISYENNQHEIGSRRDIIVKEIKDGKVYGYSDNMKQVIIERVEEEQEIRRDRMIKPGEFLKTKIASSRSFTLYGEM